MWIIPDNKQTKHRFKLESDIDKIRTKNLLIQSQNVMDCLKFFIKHSEFHENLTHKPSYIYNEKDNQIHNKIYMGILQWKNRKNLLLSNNNFNLRLG